MQIRRRSPNPPVLVQSLQFQTRMADADAKPRHILEEIIWHKETEVEQLRESLPLRDLQRQVLLAPPPRPFYEALKSHPLKLALIAEVKKASPSKGVLRHNFDPVAIAQAYTQVGATCLSVLTDEKFFQGSFDNLIRVREAVDLPILCKDFIIYPYQMYLARVKGADAVLLIAAVLSDRDLQYFLKIANGLGMAALVEVHTLAELDRVLQLDGVQLVGINNRNLETFETKVSTTVELMQQRYPEIRERGILVVSESGLQSPHDISQVHACGAKAVLIGESLVREAPEEVHYLDIQAQVTERVNRLFPESYLSAVS
ncbi:indole-3-glycerol phosphate synthase TrpC [Thermosynechococcaceae cyanobacterium BACA0444]|uniref:Indole-3-glycerol phosphate synthase n=1 Tax=Pseudocalidococcus azoricus BACA0444 TaxID=2918990 RepID=A0AAE4FWB1_9CYAN|nr:indole-3-glycerol phosphate synthase TrpC [Pseudocalidococcus azoricus]MDS3862457.1 indole-3-glycerol phosphate synthase TrpC [Pseudocalidococcus azoricus BACA0444]